MQEEPVDAVALRQAVKDTYKEVATSPNNTFHFHTGRALAKKLGYEMSFVNDLPEYAVESFAGVACPFSLGDLKPGQKVVDAGSGAGFDSFVAANMVNDTGSVIGVDMTDEMLAKAKTSAEKMQISNVEFRQGILEQIPVEDEWADVVISNGVFNLCSDKKQVFTEVLRILKPGGKLQFADIANSKTVPESATQNIDLWTA